MKTAIQFLSKTETVWRDFSMTMFYIIALVNTFFESLINPVYKSIHKAYKKFPVII